MSHRCDLETPRSLANSARLRLSASRRPESAAPRVNGPPMRDSRYLAASRRVVPIAFLVVMLVDLLYVNRANRAVLPLLVDGPIRIAQTNCPIPFPLPLQAVVSVSWDGPRRGDTFHRHKINPQRELLDDVPRYLRELFLGRVRQFDAHAPECTPHRGTIKPICRMRSCPVWPRAARREPTAPVRPGFGAGVAYTA